MIELIRDDPAPFLWLFVYLATAGVVIVAVATAVLRWFRGVIGSDDLAARIYVDGPRDPERLAREVALVQARMSAIVDGGRYGY